MQMLNVYFRFAVLFMIFSAASIPPIVGAHAQLKRGMRENCVTAYIWGIFLIALLAYVLLLGGAVCLEMIYS